MYGIIGTSCTSMCVYIRVKLPEVIGTDLQGELGNHIVRMLFGKTKLISISDLFSGGRRSVSRGNKD